MECSLPGFSVHGILQARTLEWAAISFSRTESISPLCVCVCVCVCVCAHTYLVTQSCPTLCNPVDCSSPDSSVHGILQARILEWVAIPFSRGLPKQGIKPGSPALHADFLSSEPPSPILESLIHFFTPATDSIMLKCYHRLPKDTDVFFQKDIS